jgi:hypothetical protein
VSLYVSRLNVNSGQLVHSRTAFKLQSLILIYFQGGHKGSESIFSVVLCICLFSRQERLRNINYFQLELFSSPLEIFAVAFN